jgi:hypothetical protein
MNPIVFVFLAAALIGVAFYLVALPLIQQSRKLGPVEAASSEQERLAELLAQRAAAFQAIRELNFDHCLGKITDEDFTAFEAGLKHNAAESLRALDRWEAEADAALDGWIDQQVRARRAALASEPPVDHAGGTCHRCGNRTTASDRFCGSCGAALVQEPLPQVRYAVVELTCPKCGAPHIPEDKFCAKCGQSLVAEIAPSTN